MAEALYYVDDYTDEVLPCLPNLADWADWLAKPAAEDETPRDPARPGDIFEASRLFVLGDIQVSRDHMGGWVALDPIPEGATAFYLRHHEGSQGWDVEFSGETIEHALENYDEADLDDIFLACVADGGARRLMFGHSTQGHPVLIDITEFQAVS